MINMPENIDPKTGEVLESEPKVTSTVDFGNGPINMDDAQAMDDGARGFVEKTLGSGKQMTLFEGHKVDLFEVKLKAASLGAGVIGPDTKLPKLYEKRYLVVETTAIGINHEKKVIEGDPFLLKKVTFALGKGKEIDEFTAKRLMGEGEDQA